MARGDSTSSSATGREGGAGGTKRNVGFAEDKDLTTVHEYKPPLEEKEGGKEVPHITPAETSRLEKGSSCLVS
jgi:hypothetical protein